MLDQKDDMLTVAIYLEGRELRFIKNKVKTSVFYDKGIRKNLQ